MAYQIQGDNVIVDANSFVDDPAFTGSHTYSLGFDSGVVTHGADTVFGASIGHSTMFLAGIDSQGHGSTGILGGSLSSADVVLGQNATLFGGSHDTANVTFNAGTVGAEFVTGSGRYNVLGDPTDAHTVIGGGINHIAHTTAGLEVFGNNGSVTHFFTAGPVATT